MLGSGARASAGRSWLVAGLVVSAATMAFAVYAARTRPVTGALPAEVVVTQPVSSAGSAQPSKPAKVVAQAPPTASAPSGSPTGEGATDSSSSPNNSDTTSGETESSQPQNLDASTAGSGVAESKAPVQLVLPTMPVASYAASDGSSSPNSSGDGKAPPEGNGAPQGNQQDH